MEKLHSAIVRKVANLTSNCKTDRKKLKASIISLLLASVVLVTTCFCWYSLIGGESSSGQMTVRAGNGLILNGGEGISPLRFSDNAILSPASSVDGYNLYFPADGTFTDNTQDMIFRRANAGDKNINFLQVDFTLASNIDEANVVLGSESYIRVDADSGKAGAVRLAVITELADETKVFSTTGAPVDAVSDISSFTGKVGNTTAQPVTKFEKGTNIISLSKGETSKISLIVWLEGTDSNCTKAIAGKDLDIKLVLTSDIETI